MIYYICVVLLLFFSCLEWSGENNLVLDSRAVEKCCYIFVVTLLVVVSALRYKTGCDWWNYIPFFEQCPNTNIMKLEFGYYVLNCIFKTISDNYYVLQIAVSIFCGSIVFSYLYKKSERPIFTLTLYYLFCYFMWLHMAMQRQEIAIAILILGMKFVEERKFYLWVLVVMFAMQFHSTSFLALPLYFTTERKIKRKYAILIFIFATIVEAYGYLFIREFLQFLQTLRFLPERIDTIISGYLISRHGVRFGYRTIFSLIGNNIFYISIILMYNEKEDKCMLNFLIGLLWLNVGRNFSVLFRVSYYYMICGCGMLAYNAIIRKNNMLCGRRFPKHIAMFLASFLLTFTLCTYSYVNYLTFFNDTEGALDVRTNFLPYKSVLFDYEG